MRSSTRPIDEVLSPDDVLQVLRHCHKVWLEGAATLGLLQDLTFETTVESVWSDYEVESLEYLGRDLNSIFGVNVSDSQWSDVLRTYNEEGYYNCVEDVCELISQSGAKRASCKPLRIAGQECHYAGVFLALRSMLAESTASIQSARPSTDLSPFVEKSYLPLFYATARLAPGVFFLPEPSSRSQELFGFYFFLLFALSALTLFLVGCIAPDHFFIALFEAFVTWVVASKLANRHIRKNFSSNIYLRGINTFGDLSRLLADSGISAV